MSNICQYIINLDTFPAKNNDAKKHLEFLSKFANRACFSDLWGNGRYVKSINFIPVLPKNQFSTKRARWFIEELKKWGFQFNEIEVEKKLYSRQFGQFNIEHGETPNLRRTLVNLTALRYLDHSENLFHIINDTYKWSVKFPKIDTFLLFQIAHWTYRKKYGFYFNSNHAFLDMSPGSKLCSLEKFWKRIDSDPKGGIISIIQGNAPLKYEEERSIKELINQEKIEEIVCDYLSK